MHGKLVSKNNYRTSSSFVNNDKVDQEESQEQRMRLTHHITNMQSFSAFKPFQSTSTKTDKVL